jgi:hypothetical protein
MKMKGIKRPLKEMTRDISARDNRAGEFLALEQGAESCYLMDNHEAYFSINVTIGSAVSGDPAQTFALIADTGSNALIVPDCKCTEHHGCNQGLNCFKQNESVTFQSISQKDAAGNYHPIISELSYGSGNIFVSQSSDLAAVGSVVANMTHGLYLMEDRRQLLIDGDFQGILGLGLPGSQGNAPLFTKVAGINTYTLCFNADTQPGVIKMNAGALANPMTNIGQVHWGLDLQGMSVGNESVPVIFCDPATKLSNMTTACAAIPDSGTTMMIGPKEQVKKLQEAICDHWPRCKQIQLNFPQVPKVDILAELLFNCSDWLNESSDELSSMPPIYVTLAGAEGIPQKVKLPASAYILETEQELFKRVIVKMNGKLPVAVQIDTGIQKKVCVPAFNAEDVAYNTVLNGPVWILGTPLFYSHTIGYDIGVVPPKISVESTPCMECGGSQLKSRETGTLVSPRKLRGPLLQKIWNISQQL